MPVSPIEKHSVVVAGHKTSVSMERPFWDELKRMAAERKLTLGALVGDIDGRRHTSNLSSALRVAVLLDVLEDRPRPALAAE